MDKEEEGDSLTIVDDVTDAAGGESSVGTRKAYGSGMYADTERSTPRRGGRMAATGDASTMRERRESRRLYDSHDIETAAAQIVSSDSVESLLAFGESLAKPRPTATVGEAVPGTGSAHP